MRCRRSLSQRIMLRRAGVTTQEETLDAFRKHIAACENSTGHLFQSATEASFANWDQGQGTGGRRGGSGGISKTVSYYEKGPVIGLLLDFKIRHETKNKKSLDTVMRTLYQDYFKKLKRGWTEDELSEALMHLCGYIGLPSVREALITAKEVFHEMRNEK